MGGISDVVRFEAEGGRPEELLTLCAANGIAVYSAVRADEYTLRFTVRSAHAGAVEKIAERALCSVKVIEKKGFTALWPRVKKRYILLLGLVVCAALLIWSSFYVWDIEVTGNESTGRGEILRALDECGVAPGTSVNEISAPILRSEVLLKLPQLSWLTVNVNGSRATVVVREREKKPEIEDKSTPARVIASKAGIITSVRAYDGFACVSKGDTVSQGDVLVSGAMESIAEGRYLVHASADVTARTWYEIEGKAPLEVSVKEYTGREKMKYALIAGRKRINFYLSSGNSYASCDKIIKVKKLSLNGAFNLPFSTVREVWREYELKTEEIPTGELQSRIENELTAYLKELIGEDGTVSAVRFQASCADGVMTVRMRAECEENISVTDNMTEDEIKAALSAGEEVETIDGKDDGR